MSLVGDPPRQVWVCWRNKCGHRERPDGSEADAPKAHRYRDESELALGFLPPAAASAISERYMLPQDALYRYGVLYSYSYERVAWPLASPRSGWRKHAYVLRTWKAGDNRPKALTVPLSSMGRMGWYCRLLPVGALHILVEDCISALRIAEAGHIGISLQGTRILPQDILELHTYASHAPVLLALDNDATSRAILYGERLGIRVLPLQRDIKNQTHEQLAKTIERAGKLAKSGNR